MGVFRHEAGNMCHVLGLAYSEAYSGGGGFGRWERQLCWWSRAFCLVDERQDGWEGQTYVVGLDVYAGRSDVHTIYCQL